MFRGIDVDYDYDQDYDDDYEVSLSNQRPEHSLEVISMPERWLRLLQDKAPLEALWVKNFLR